MTENMVCLWYSETPKKTFDSHDNCMCSLFVNTLEYLENNPFCYHQKLCKVFLVKARMLTISLKLSFCCL